MCGGGSKGAVIDEKLPTTGEMFEGRYELRDVLGRGGFAVVYRALDTVMSREVAIKVLAPLGGPQANNVRQRFMREAAVFASLEDPHTITMFDFGEAENGLLFMVFEYLQSEELKDVIKRGPGVHPRIATHILIQLAGALREAHQKDIYHRDIKPANVLVYEYDGDPYRVKLIDFGIAKDASPDVARLTRTGRIIGTPRYMAPEQLFGQPPGPESDLYSLGLVGFELIAGRPAVEGTTNKDVMKRQVSEEPFVVPPELAPPMLRRVLERMMAKERRARYQSATALLDDLRAAMPEARAWKALDDEEVDTIAEDSVETLIPETTAPPTSTGPVSTRPSPPWGAVVAVALVVVALGLVLYVVTRPPEPDPVVAPTTRSNIGSLLAPKTPVSPSRTPPPREDVGVAEVREPKTGCGTAQEPGLYAYRYELAPRGWLVRIPEGYDPNVKHPVMMLFHRSWLGAKDILRDTKLGKTADANDVVIVSFDSEDTLPWQDPHDMEFVFRTLQKVEESVCVDYSRLYAVGDGAGGGFIEKMACSFPLSAVVTTAHGRWDGDKDCAPVAPTAHLRIYGAIDKHVPVDGGAGCVPLTGPFISAADIRASWTSIYRCEGPGRAWGAYDGGKCTTWTCELGSLVECETTGGHYWPGAPAPALDLPSCKTEDPKPNFPYREAVWDFLSREGAVLGPEQLRAQRALLDW